MNNGVVAERLGRFIYALFQDGKLDLDEVAPERLLEQWAVEHGYIRPGDCVLVSERRVKVVK